MPFRQIVREAKYLASNMIEESPAFDLNSLENQDPDLLDFSMIYGRECLGNCLRQLHRQDFNRAITNASQQDLKGLGLSESSKN